MLEFLIIGGGMFIMGVFATHYVSLSDPVDVDKKINVIVTKIDTNTAKMEKVSENANDIAEMVQMLSKSQLELKRQVQTVEHAYEMFRFTGLMIFVVIILLGFALLYMLRLNKPPVTSLNKTGLIKWSPLGPWDQTLLMQVFGVSIMILLVVLFCLLWQIPQKKW